LERKSRREEDKTRERLNKEKRRSRSRRRRSKSSTERGVKEVSTTVKQDTPKREEKPVTPQKDEKTPPREEEKEEKDEALQNEVKLTEDAIESTPELPTEDMDNEEEEIQAGEKMKFEPIIIERKTIRKIERPKVNIFLEDSDEVDEFENANVITTLEVKSKWSSPELVKPEPNEFEDNDSNSNTMELVPKAIESRLKEKHAEVSEVVETPEKSPITPSTERSIFESSSTISKSPTPSKPVKNVCSFLSDIESEGYLSGFSLGSSGIYSDDDDDEHNKYTDKLEPSTYLNSGSLFSKNPEPDTTIEERSDKEKKEKDSDDDSDSDDSDSSSSSESSSDSSSSESEDESSDSSDDETTAIVSRFGGFGRFDATSIPMVTQIKAVLTQTMAGATAEPTVVQSRFQPQQSIIRPPGLVTNLTRPPLYPAGPVIATPSTPFATPTGFATPFGTGQFPVPFKIYSLKDAGNTGIIFPSTAVTPIAPITPVPTEREKERTRESERERDRDRDRDKRPEKRERERHRSRSHSRDRERDRKRHKDDRRESERRKTPPSKKRSLTPKRRSPSPIKRKHTDDKRDTKRREPSPRHSSSSHSSRSR
jgi:hypothetical protein